VAKGRADSKVVISRQEKGASLGADDLLLIFVDTRPLNSYPLRVRVWKLTHFSQTAVTPRIRLTRPLPLIACLLTLMASGDDLNLPRLLILSAPTPLVGGGLPVDDDNADFVKPSPGPILKGQDSAWNSLPCGAEWDLRPVCPTPQPFEATAPVDCRTCLLPASFPLRC
jgi:hypothetical protein